MKNNYLEKERLSQRVVMIAALTIPVLLTACSSSLEPGDPLVAADEMKDGPGIFSGKAGGFYLVGKPSHTPNYSPERKMSLEETTRAINNKIEQLDQDKKELIQLKLQLKQSQIY